MARTPIPPDLIRHPEEAQRDGRRFDQLCQLVEEIALPVVQSALYRETIEAGADVLTEEARIALKVLAADEDLLQELDEGRWVQQVRESLSNEIPLPDKKEALQHARDFSQVLTSAWLETLRGAEAVAKIVILSDYLVPHLPSQPWAHSTQSATSKYRMPEILIEATAWFAVNEEDVLNVLRTLRAKLFPKPLMLELPFDLILAGTPERSPMVLSRRSLDRLVEAMQDRKIVASRPYPIYDHAEPADVGTFATPETRNAFNSLAEPLPAPQYQCLAWAALPKWKEESIEVRVRAFTAQK